MKVKLVLLLSVLILIFSCSKKVSLEEDLSCSNFDLFLSTIEKSDVHNNFKIDIPKKWKYKFYYDDFQSSLFLADTLKQLTNTFILDIAYKNGELILNNQFVASLEKNSKHTIVKSNFEVFLDLDSYWQVVKGVKKNYPFHEFSMYIKISDLNYLQITSEMYGQELVDERICKMFSIINSLEIINY